MDISLDNSPELIAVGSANKTDFLNIIPNVRAFALQVLHAQSIGISANKRIGPASLMKQVYTLDGVRVDEVVTNFVYSDRLWWHGPPPDWVVWCR